MPNERRSRRAAETGLRSVERLLEDGETRVARLAFDLIGPGTKRIADRDQLARLRAASLMVAARSDEAVPEAETDGEEYPPAGFSHS